jgi:hypothetical protein
VHLWKGVAVYSHLLLAIILISAFGWIASGLIHLTSTRSHVPKGEWSHVFAALILAALVYLITLPHKPPFSSGHALGVGFLLGGIASVLGYLILMRVPMDPSDKLSGMASYAAPLFSFGAMASIGVMLKRDVMTDLLPCLCIGWISCTFIQFAPIIGRPKPGDTTSSVSDQWREYTLLGTAIAMAFAIVTCIGILLAANRNDDPAVRIRMEIAILLFAISVPSVLLIGAGIQSILNRFIQTKDGEIPFRLLHFLFVLVELLMIVWVGKSIEHRLLSDEPIIRLVLVGMGIGICVWKLSEELGKRTNPGIITLLTALLLIGGYIVGFYEMNGYGIAVVWLSMLSPFMIAFHLPRSNKEHSPVIPSSQTIVGGLFFAVLLLVFRITNVVYAGDTYHANLSDHFALVGLATGFFTPRILSYSVHNMLQENGLANNLIRLTFLGILTLLSPALLIFLWGAKCIIAFLIGLAFSSILPDEEERTTPSPTTHMETRFLYAMIASAMGMAILEWAGYALNAATLSKSDKVHILIWVFGTIAVCLLLLEYLPRITGSIFKRTATPASSDPQQDKLV